MEFENYFYVLLAVIYILSRVLKNRRKVAQDETLMDKQPKQGKKPVSFEDLLKQFGAEKEGEEIEKVEREVVQEVEEIEEPPREYKSIHSDEEAKSIFEKSIKEAELISEKEATAENKALAFKEFKPYQKKDESNEFANEIRELLQTPYGGKKAVILAEILNRKY